MKNRADVVQIKIVQKVQKFFKFMKWKLIISRHDQKAEKQKLKMDKCFVVIVIAKNLQNFCKNS